jgi:hypothetical protein
MTETKLTEQQLDNVTEQIRVNLLHQLEDCDYSDHDNDGVVIDFREDLKGRLLGWEFGGSMIVTWNGYHEDEDYFHPGSYNITEQRVEFEQLEVYNDNTDEELDAEQVQDIIELLESELPYEFSI